MARAFLFVLDSFGIGCAPDAARYGDTGADTYGSIQRACAEGRGDRAGLRKGPLLLPNLDALGLRHASALSHGTFLPVEKTVGFYGAATETSLGKDTPSGHWEIASHPVDFEWGYFPNTVPTLPTALTEAIISEGELPGIIGNCHASGTGVIDDFGEEHIRTGQPIFYTSVDSVLQIAAHEVHFGLERLYALCQLVRRHVDPLSIGRVIARPFVGETITTFVRTPNRRDYATPPPRDTLLDRITQRGSRVFGIGKIGDIFAHRGVSETRKAANNMAMFDEALTAMDDAQDGDLVFVNFVDFDTNFGHRRDVAGYAAALEAFDRRIPEALDRLQTGDMLILTADHGCDPTFKGTDHTRERVPVLGIGPGLKPASIGVRPTFADIGETIAAHLHLTSSPVGTSFLPQIVSVDA